MIYTIGNLDFYLMQCQIQLFPHCWPIRLALAIELGKYANCIFCIFYTNKDMFQFIKFNNIIGIKITF